MKSLQELYQQDREALDNFYKFQIEVLEKLAVEKVFAKEDVTGIADAKEAIDKSYEELTVLFNPKPKTTYQNPR